MSNDNNGASNVETLFPIGTICKLKGDGPLVAIVGFYPLITQTKMTQYMGCFYPYGIMNQNECLFFNNDEIDKVVFIGYNSTEEEKFKTEIINDVKKKIDNRELELITIDEEHPIKSYKDSEQIN